MSKTRNWMVVGLVLTATLASGGELTSQPQARCASQAGKVLVLSGAVSEGGLKGRFSRSVDLGSGRYIETRDYGVIQTGSGYDGSNEWSRDVSGFAHVLNSAFARRLARSQAWFSTNQGCRSAVEHQSVVPPDGAPIEVWYDGITGLPNRAIFEYSENRLVRHYADWRDVGSDVSVAFRQDDEDVEDESTTTFIVQQASLRRGHSTALFDLPSEPADVRFLDRRKTSTVPYEDDHRTRIYIPVHLNGKGPFTFELDSGGHFILAPNTVLALGLQPRGAFSSTGAGNDVLRAGYVSVDSVRIGAVQMVNQTAKVLPWSAQSNDRGTQPPRAGILGLEVFERLRVRIDRSMQTVTLESPASGRLPSPWVAVPMTFDEDAPLVMGSFGGVRGPFMIDTGNAGSTIVEHYWAAQHGVAQLFDSALPVGKDVKVASTDLSLGPFALSGEVLSYYGAQPRGSEHTRSVAAITGEPLLSRFDLVFDYSAGVLWLKPLPDRAPIPFNRAGALLAKAADGSFTISSVISGSPAAEVGLKSGDIIDAIGAQPSRLLSRADVLAMFQQKAGTPLEIRLRESSSTNPGRSLILHLRDAL